MFSCAQLTLGYLNAQALLEERFHAVSANHFLRSTISYGNGLSRTLDRSQDNLLRPSGFQLMNGTTEEHATSYGYDKAGRLAGVHTAAAYSATPDFSYNYLANSGSLVESVTSPAHTVTNSYETTRNVLDVKSNAANGANPSVVSAFDYSVNNLGQRNDVSRTGSAFISANTETWNYNAKGEVVTANHSNNAFDRSFEFDGIGNRKKSADSITLPTADNYIANTLNQLTTVNGGTRIHDVDGNLTDNGSHLYEWDGENRLIEIKLKSDNSTVATYAYDYKSRRITKTVGTTETNFVYNGWNPIAEYTSALSPLSFTLSTSYTWGMDLSGSMQGAGGVGGLLSVNDGSDTYYPTFDGNGNVSEYVDATGAVVAHYEYDAFGQVVASGTKADEFTHQFSTKQLDSESGLHYYGYRYYDSSNGRWPSRDPIEENGGENLYGFVRNNGVNSLDQLGLRVVIFEVSGEPWHCTFTLDLNFSQIDRGNQSGVTTAFAFNIVSTKISWKCEGGVGEHCLGDFTLKIDFKPYKLSFRKPTGINQREKVSELVDFNEFTLFGPKRVSLESIGVGSLKLKKSSTGQKGEGRYDVSLQSLAPSKHFGDMVIPSSVKDYDAIEAASFDLTLEVIDKAGVAGLDTQTETMRFIKRDRIELNGLSYE